VWNVATVVAEFGPAAEGLVAEDVTCGHLTVCSDVKVGSFNDNVLGIKIDWFLILLCRTIIVDVNYIFNFKNILCLVYFGKDVEDWFACGKLNSDVVKDTSLKAEAKDSTLKVKAKDSTLKAEAKTKDFKIVLEDPRARGLILEDSDTEIKPFFHIGAASCLSFNIKYK